jgi:transposase
MKLENEWFRPAAYYLVKMRGIKRKDVASMFGVKPHTVSDAIMRYNETGSHSNRKGQGRKRSARDDSNVEQVKEILKANNHTKTRGGVPGSSTRKIAKRLNISHKSAHRILKDDLKLTAWKKGQKLTKSQREKRLKLAKELKKRFSDGRHRQILFTDEKYFPVTEARKMIEFGQKSDQTSKNSLLHVR